MVNAWWVDFTEKNRRPFPSEISIAEDQVSEYLWVQMVVEAQPEDEEAEGLQHHGSRLGRRVVGGYGEGPRRVDSLDQPLGMPRRGGSCGPSR